jgi:hypothetical protein
MVKTTFDPQAHGFAFTNAWGFEQLERQRLRDLSASYLRWSTILGAAAFGLAGGALIPLGLIALRKKVEDGLGQGYGLCGGMCFAALDAYLASAPLQRGTHAHDHPAAGTPLRGYLWKRQIQSLSNDLPRFLAWLILLNYVPSSWPFKGGRGRLAAMSEREWDKLRCQLDAGRPVPLGLVRDTKNVFENHQVLATGYNQEGTRHGTIHVYDPNCPNVDSTIHLSFDQGQPVFEESCTASMPLRGFFCETYRRPDLSEALAAPAAG